MAVSSDTTARGDVRLARERPEPSTAHVRAPSCAAVARTTAAPAAVVPAPPKLMPRSLIRVSAMKLSEATFMAAMTPATGGELQPDSGTAPAGAMPARAAPRTLTPRLRSVLVNARAVKRGGTAWKYGLRRPVKPWLKVSALSGPTSPEV